MTVSESKKISFRKVARCRSPRFGSTPIRSGFSPKRPVSLRNISGPAIESFT